MPKGGKRKGAGRKATGVKRTSTINIRVPPKLKQKAVAKSGNSLTAYIIRLIEADLKKD